MKKNLAFIKRFGARQVSFAALPPSARLALACYCHDVHGKDSKDEAMLREAMDEAREKFRCRKFWIASIPMAALQAEIVARGLEGAPFPYADFAAYHEWYVKQGGIPDHGDSHWPCVLSEYDDEVFEDGWHRFHSYVQKGHRTVLVVF